MTATTEATKTPATRIYLVTGPEGEPDRLVRAKSPAGAVGHVTKPFKAAIATQDELVRLVADGTEIEKADLAEDPAS